MNGLGKSIVLTFSQCSSSIDERHWLGTHLNIGLSRHGGTADIGSGRVGSIGVGVGVGGRRVRLGSSRDGRWRSRGDMMIDQRTSFSWG